MSHNFTHFQCPVCGRNVGIKGYDPKGYPADVLGLTFRGKGYARGFEVSEKESLLYEDDDDPVLVKIKERVALIYDLFFEEPDDVVEHLDDINALLGTQHETLLEASFDMLSQLEDYVEEDEDDDASVPHGVGAVDDAKYELVIDDEPLSELDREMLIGESEEP